MARVLLGLVGAAWAVLFVGWLSLHWLILPHIEEWRAPIETRASHMLGATVKIGAIEVRSSGWVPAIELRDVRILDAEQRVALSLPRVAAAFSAHSLLAFEPRFEQLLIDAPSLDIRRDAAGRIHVAGLDFGSLAAGGEEGSAAADWFFRQDEFVIRGGTLRWIDEQRQAPPLVLNGVDLVVRNGLRNHQLRLDATPPPEWGDRFTVRGRFDQPLFARAGEWQRWSGSAFADLPRADVRELRRHVDLPFELSEGDGALRGWFEVKEGRPEGATVDVLLRAVALRLDKSVEPLEFEQIEGRIGAERQGDRTVISVHGFGFVTGDGIHWPKGDLSVTWRQPDGQDIDSGEFFAERLDVGVMAQIAGRVPLGVALRNLLADVRPQGVITKLSTHWDGPIDAPEHYRVKGALSGLSLSSRAAPHTDAVGRPGLSNATVELEANEAGGQARIGVKQGVLDLPGVFAEPAVPLDRLDARLSWKVEAARSAGEQPKITVKVADARFANADAAGELSGTWHTGAGVTLAHGGRYPGELELDGRIVNAQAQRTARYLPLGLPDSVRSYIARAVRGGTIASATVRVRGDLWDFPFHDARSGRGSEFRIAAKVDDLTFAYVPPARDATGAGSAAAADAAQTPTWPALTALSGELVVERNALEIRNARARLAGVEWSRIHGTIAALGDHARLDLDGDARGALADMLRYVNATPIGRWTGRALAAASATGAADLKLALAIPLGDPGETHVKGSLALAGNDVRMAPDTPLLGAARARVDFTQSSYSVAAASARVLGGELSFEGGSHAGNVQRFSGQGTVTAEALRRAGELGSLARLAGSLNGQTSYRATLAFVAGQPQIGVTSNLVGIGIQLPAPLGKAAATPLALRVQTVGDESGSAAGAATPRETLQLEVGEVLRARFVRERSGETSRVVRGAIRMADADAVEPAAALALPPAGVAATIVLKRLDLDAWQAAADRIQAEPEVAGAGTAPLVFDAAGGAGYLPDTIGLRVAEFDAGSRHLTNLTAGLSRDGALWRANIDSHELDGYVEYRPARRGTAATSAGAGRVYARLSRLSLPKGDAERVESLLDEQPSTVPALDIVVDDFELRGKRLGRLEIEAANRSGRGRDAVREWQLSKFNLVTPEAQLSASGTWGAANAAPAGSASAAAPATVQPRASMNFTLTLVDSGALLERLGMGKVIRGGKGSLSGTLAWPGSPLSLDTTKMTGQIKVAIDSGQFLKAGPGAARLLSVLSLQSLPRRLLFDFRDLFEEGFVFDNVVGDVKIGQGVATTNNLRMRGAAAVVLMEGAADLEHETEDVRVVVVPEINAGTASLAYAIINPAVGLGTFLAQYFLRKPLMAASTREFRVTGPWDEPKVDRIERPMFREVPEAPAVESPAAAAEASAPTTR